MPASDAPAPTPMVTLPRGLVDWWARQAAYGAVAFSSSDVTAIRAAIDAPATGLDEALLRAGVMQREEEITALRARAEKAEAELAAFKERYDENHREWTESVARERGGFHDYKEIAAALKTAEAERDEMRQEIVVLRADLEVAEVAKSKYIQTQAAELRAARESGGDARGRVVVLEGALREALSALQVECVRLSKLCAADKPHDHDRLRAVEATMRRLAATLNADAAGRPATELAPTEALGGTGSGRDSTTPPPRGVQEGGNSSATPASPATASPPNAKEGMPARCGCGALLLAPAVSRHVTIDGVTHVRSPCYVTEPGVIADTAAPPPEPFLARVRSPEFRANVERRRLVLNLTSAAWDDGYAGRQEKSDVTEAAEEALCDALGARREEGGKTK